MPTGSNPCTTAERLESFACARRLRDDRGSAFDADLPELSVARAVAASAEARKMGLQQSRNPLPAAAETSSNVGSRQVKMLAQKAFQQLVICRDQVAVFVQVANDVFGGLAHGTETG